MFLDTLNALMDRRGLTKSALAKESGIPYTTIDGWYKRGADDIRLSTLRRLANFFGVTIDELLGREPLPAAPQVTAITSAERSYLSKVRALDDSGRALVKTVIDHEHDRCSAPAAEAAPADDDSNVVNLTGLFPHLGLASAGPGAPKNKKRRPGFLRAPFELPTISNCFDPLGFAPKAIGLFTYDKVNISIHAPRFPLPRHHNKVGHPCYVDSIVSRFSQKSRKIFRFILSRCLRRHKRR